MDSQTIANAIAYIRTKTDIVPEVGIVLGSGLGEYAQTVIDPVAIEYKDIPGFPVSSVEGHASKFVLGECMGKRVIMMCGRFHYYEGYTQQQTTLPIRVMKQLGVQTLMLTNAAGGINRGFSSGTLMAIADHINYSGNNPLIGKNLDEYGPRFPDMSNAYDRNLRDKVIAVARANGINIEEGVYIYFSGPSYETPAEVRMAALLGADAAGMSTVPEAIVANHCGMRVVGISCITNMAAGILDTPIVHSEVMETAARVREQFKLLLNKILQEVL